MVMLGTFLMVALVVLALRHHRLEVTSETVWIHDEILARKQMLLDQRVEIARQTNPWALAAGLKAAGMDTGNALESRTSSVPKAPGPVIPRVETDLVAPVVDSSGGHSNANRPKG
jgi:hypothetical protein